MLRKKKEVNMITIWYSKTENLLACNHIFNTVNETALLPNTVVKRHLSSIKNMQSTSISCERSYISILHHHLLLYSSQPFNSLLKPDTF